MYFLVSKDNYFGQKLFKKLGDKFIFITTKKELEEKLKLKPDKLFFLHWSYIVPNSIINEHECINIHTGNLPHGKGGSPIQNQILDSILFTRVNALRMTNEVDGGPIYCSKEVTLQGNLFDIWNTITESAYMLITNIIENDVSPEKQPIVDDKVYKRRKNNEIDLQEINSLEEIYDLIRMLDSPYYPTTYMQLGEFKLEFSRALYNGENILCDVKILKK